MQFERNIIHRPKTSNLYDGEPSLGHILIKSLMNAGDKTMIVCGVTGRELSAKEIVNKSIEIAKALIAAGIKRGDIVSIISETCFEYVFVLFGTIFINCTLAPLNHTYSHRELVHALNFSKPKFLFTGGSTTKSVLDIAKNLSYVKKIICFDGYDGPMKDLTISLSNFTDSKNLQNVNFEPRPVNIYTANCLIMCSSGTTGVPKGVQLSQSGLIATACITKEFFYTKSNVGDEEPVILGLLPLFHVFGSVVLICIMANVAGKLILLPKFEEKSFLRSIEKYRCTFAYLVPPLMNFLAKNELVDKYDLSSLKCIICGAAPLSKELEQSVKDRLKNSNLLIKQLYGMTELTSTVLMQKDIVKPGSVGDVNTDIYAKVIDESGNALGPNQKGELCFKGGLMMLGYISDTKATNAIIDDDGWLHTGDIGYYDEDLQFFIVDRIKELIKYKGFQVPPAGLQLIW